MQLRDIARNVPVLSPGSLPPGWRSASDIPPTPETAGPLSALDEAMRRRERMVAAKAQEGAMKQLEAQAELEQMEIEVRTLEAQAKLADLRAQLRPQQQQQGDGDGFLKYMLDKSGEREKELAAQVADLQKQQMQANSQMLAQLSEEMKELRSGAIQPPKTIVETIGEALSLQEAIQSLTGGSPVKGVNHKDLLEEMKLRHEMRMRELQFDRDQARGEREEQLANQKLQLEEARYSKLAQTLDSAAPTFMTLVGNLLSKNGQEMEMPAGAVPVNCGNCHKEFAAMDGWVKVGATCPYCSATNYAEAPAPPAPVQPTENAEPVDAEVATLA